MRIVLLGPPGAGKGTQAVKLAEKLGVPQVSTGDLFRHNISTGTKLGLEAKKYMEAGEYVPDSVTNGMVADRLSQSDAAAGFLLDGYPRTVDQVHALNAMLMLSYVALREGDSVGLICFSDDVHTYIPPKGGRNQMNRLFDKQSCFPLLHMMIDNHDGDECSPDDISDTSKCSQWK